MAITISPTDDLLLCCLAGLDDENKELQQKLAALKVESRQKEAVNQALARELSDRRHKQQTEQLGESGRCCTPCLHAAFLSLFFFVINIGF